MSLSDEQRYTIDMNERLKLGREQVVVNVCNWVIRLSVLKRYTMIKFTRNSNASARG